MPDEPLTLNNYEMLDLFGMIEMIDDEHCKLSDDVVVLRDDEDRAFRDKPKIFPLSEIFEKKIFTIDELDYALTQREEDLKHLRLFLAHFRRQEDGRLSQKQDYWVKFKAWRYDIDDPGYTLDYISSLYFKLHEVALRPSIIKKSNKGWHLIYVVDEFIERDVIESYKNYNEKGYLQYMVYEIFTKLFPLYLKELEPKLDIRASNNVSMIATRFRTESLPAYSYYMFGPEYHSLKTVFETLSFLTKKVFDYDTDYHLDFNNKKPNDKKAIFTVSDISKEEFYTGISRCAVLKALDDDWENHGYEEWFLMATVYAIKILYTENEAEKEELIEEFHKKSSKYRNYNQREAEYFLNKIIEYQSESLKIHSCRSINERINPKYLNVCKSCPYKKTDKEGNIYGHYLFSYLYKENLEDEDVKIDGWILKENGWNKYIAKTDSYVQVLPYFKIRRYYIVGKEEDEFIEMLDKTGRNYIRAVERKNSYKPSIEVLKRFGEVNLLMEHDAKIFLGTYIEKVKAKRGVIVDFVGYKYETNSWNIVVGGYGKFSRKELHYIFYGDDKDDSYVPEVKGNVDIFQDICWQLFRLNDPPLHLMMAHYLSWIGKEFTRDVLLFENINPILLVIGDSQIGKSIRAKAAAGLFGTTALFSFSNISLASFTNRFPLIQTPFCIDEVVLNSEFEERKFALLIYNIANIQRKMIANATYNPITVPVILTGETESLPINKIFDTYRGLNRRSILLEMTDEWTENTDAILNALKQLQLHHGYILYYVLSLKEEDKKEILNLMESFKKQLNFGKNNFGEITIHLSLSFAMFAHFFYRYVGLAKSVVMNKVNDLIQFVVNQINTRQLKRIGGNIDYVDEIVHFISKVEEALNTKKTLRGLSYERLCTKIGYNPASKVANLLKKFFWKRYASSSSSSTRLYFVPSVLIIDPFKAVTDDEKAEMGTIILADKDRLMELTDDELKIWAEVLKVRYNEDMVRKIVDRLRDDRLTKIISTLNTTSIEVPF
jgi:hypothetical protein